MRLLYLNQGSQFETWLCSCVRYLLGELYRPNSLTWLESELVEAQCSLRILYNLIHQKNYYSKSNAIKVTTNYDKESNNKQLIIQRFILSEKQ